MGLGFRVRGLWSEVRGFSTRRHTAWIRFCFAVTPAACSHYWSEVKKKSLYGGGEGPVKEKEYVGACLCVCISLYIFYLLIVYSDLFVRFHYLFTNAFMCLLSVV